MATILNEQSVREVASKLGAQQEQGLNKQRAFATELIAAVEKKEASDAIFGDIASLLALPDEKFVMLSPIFLDEMEKSYNDPQTQLALGSIVNVYGLDENNIESEMDASIDKVIKQFSGTLSTIKIDFITELISNLYNAMLAVKGLSKKIVAVPVCLCDENAILPEYAHATDAGADIFAIEDVDIMPGETKLIRTGVRLAIPRGYEIQIRAKSGRASKSKMRLANGIGTVDTGFRDEIKIIAENIEPRIKDLEWDPTTGKVLSVVYGSPIHIGKGEKIAQLVLSQVPKIKWEQVEAVESIGEDRGGGFGSTTLYSAKAQKDGQNNN